MNTKAFCHSTIRGQSSEDLPVEYRELIILPLANQCRHQGNKWTFLLLSYCWVLFSMKNCSSSTIYFPYWFSCRQLEHPNKCGLLGLVEIISLYVLVSWKSSKSSVKGKLFHLTSAGWILHTVVTREKSSHHCTNKWQGKRPVSCSFPSTLLYSYSQGKNCFLLWYFPLVEYIQGSPEVTGSAKLLHISRTLVLKRWKLGHKNPMW